MAHMEQVNLKKYQITTVDDALAVLEENGDTLPGEGLREIKSSNASLDRGLSLSTRGGHAIQASQKGKKDTLSFTLQVGRNDQKDLVSTSPHVFSQVLHRRIHRSDRLALVHAQLDVLEKSLGECWPSSFTMTNLTFISPPSLPCYVFADIR